MIGTVERIDYDGERVHSVVLRFPSREAPSGTIVKEITACEHIGQGSFGTVYRAYCDGYPRLALKISTGKATRLKQELEVLSKVCTKGALVLPRFEFGALNKAADLIVIGMELCVPSTLHDLLLSTRITDEADMLFLGYQAAQAVACVHKEGCIHRDIKLQNFVFDVDGNLKLIDFGLSCSSLRPPAGDVVAGTVSFMSPEMAHNALHKDKRVSVGVAADIWSLGIVLFSIFTQRNPYPPNLTSSAEGSGLSSSSSSSSEQPSSAARHNANGNTKDSSTGRRALNERLLRRVASGAWRWPPGCVLSDALRDLIMSTLVPDPARRPDIDDVLRKKVWALRRRTPPSAVTAFLGVQDDILLLSRDSESHLMRAVEERSADMATSRIQSRMHSPRSSPDNENNNSSDGGRREAMRMANGTSKAAHTEAEEEEQQQHLTAMQTPTRPQGSLKVVVAAAAGEVDGGVPCVQVYDVRASTRKRSKPIREISLVIAAETAKTRSRSRRAGLSTRPRVNSAEPPHAPQPASVVARSNVDTTVEGQMRSHTAVDSKVAGEPEREHVIEADDTFSTFTTLTTTTQPLLSSSTPALSSQAIVQTVEEGDNQMDMSMPTVRRGRSRPRTTSATPTSRTVSAHASMCLLDEDDNDSESSSKGDDDDEVHMTSVPVGRTVKATSSSSVRASRKRARATSTSRRRAPTRRNAKTAPVVTALDADTVQMLLKQHNVVADMIALDQTWLLASLRLTIEEDQERYNIVWLAAEQAKSAAHPHKFKEVFQITSKKYQYGFVCDRCDYEFLPGGRNGKALHFFHCPCGRDLCPECYAAFRVECSCPACHTVCANHIDLRMHRCNAHPIVKAENVDIQQATVHAMPARRGRPPTRGTAAQGRKQATQQQRRGRMQAVDVDNEEEETDMKLSMAAMQQKVVSRQPPATRGAKPETFSKAIDRIPAGPWQPFAKLRREPQREAALQPSPEERELLLNGEWVRHCYLYPSDGAQEPYAFVYHIQPGRTGAIYLSDDFALHSAVFSMLERQFFAIDAVDLQDGEDTTRVTTLLRAKSHPDLAMSFRALQEIVAYDTNMLKQHRVLGTVSIYQAPRSAFSSSGQAFLYVRWFRFSEDGSLTAFMLSNGGVQVFVRNEYELRWFDEKRKFLVRCNGVCEMVDDDSFVLGPAINHLLYDTFDEDS